MTDNRTNIETSPNVAIGVNIEFILKTIRFTYIIIRNFRTEGGIGAGSYIRIHQTIRIFLLQQTRTAYPFNKTDEPLKFYS